MPRRWGTAERMMYILLSTHSEVLCRCGRHVTFERADQFWRPVVQATCPKCGREHRVRVLCESRAAERQEEEVCQR